RQMRLDPPVLWIADFDRHARVGELLDGLVAHGGQEDVDLHLVVGVDAKAACPDGILNGRRHRVDRQRRLGAGRWCGPNEVGQDSGQFRTLGGGGGSDRDGKKANKKRSHSLAWFQFMTSDLCRKCGSSPRTRGYDRAGPNINPRASAMAIASV